VHVGRELAYSWEKGFLAGSRGFVRPVHASVEFTAGRFRVALKLSSPDTSEIEVRLSILVNERCGVDRERVGDRLGIGSEWTFRLVGDSDSDLEDT
jgi:hypothetical protein